MSTTSSTPDLFREVFPDLAKKASTVCVDMGISTVGVLEAALEDKELTDELLRRLALPQGVTRLRDTDPSLQVDSALGTYLRSYESHELIAVALAKPAVSQSGIPRPPSGKGIRRQGSAMHFGADTCRFTRQSCPFGRDCRYRKHFGDPQSKPYWQNGQGGEKDSSFGSDKRPRTGQVKDERSRKNPKDQ
ncbi:hypothetical protein Pmar_PMAR019283 [Perkinsus marinus ATCC 50983]|uniref:C3H1-type domain-containing protein n=1 Tax=Perkinsus marinus (strain ATCC 50983 / TXsc) TaxID=423536 RepID=C5KEC4_PERM5|nr:hypothetical protein Pmar_PMAR019283 [Perkinsus marinus ATCC 50983]EER17170.1 hypothetical protein Pmar_PMAR019283 [Perkinsus marinus ATCC 50983]|eukprot:XP_002785374.1 hypothetical protein Pmar_PMAR019283 [Perkinsus marinus ATCC 50983]